MSVKIFVECDVLDALIGAYDAQSAGATAASMPTDADVAMRERVDALRVDMANARAAR